MCCRAASEVPYQVYNFTGLKNDNTGDFLFLKSVNKTLITPYEQFLIL